MPKNGKKKIVAFVLCLTLIVGTGIGLPNWAGSRASTRPQETAADLENVTGSYSLADIQKEQYADAVSENVARRTGKGNVIVQVAGDSLYDAYTASGDTRSFAAYVSSDAATAKAAAMEKKHDKILARMRSKGVAGEKKYSYTALANAFSVEIDYADIHKIEKISGVESVYYSNTYAAPAVTVSSNDANVYTTGIYDTTEVRGEGYDGSGMVVAVLDTGLDYTHPAFDPKNMNEETVGGGSLFR